MSYTFFHIVQILLIVSIFPVFMSSIYHFYCFDRVVRFEFKNYKNEWIKDGKPYGFFWTSKESTYWQGCISRNACLEKWLKENPEWIQNDSKVTHLLNRLRFSKRLAYFSLGVCGVIFIIFLIFRKAGFEL